jgi:hypothetical protein
MIWAETKEEGIPYGSPLHPVGPAVASTDLMGVPQRCRLLLYRSPKLALGVFGVTMLLAGVFLLISDVATSGANYKTKGISRSAHGER